MDAAKMNQAIRIAKLYYELHYNQLEIAAREGISKSSVSRILKNAMDMGIIEVRIKDSVLANGNLENELIARFPIKRAIIVPDLVGNFADINAGCLCGISRRPPTLYKK